MNGLDYIKEQPLKTFRRGEVLLQKGESLSRLMAIRQGFVKVTSISDAGVERLLWIAGRYDVTPTEQLFSKYGESRFFYTALTDGDYFDLEKEQFLGLAAEHPEIMTEIARNMSVHYDDFLQRVDAADAATVKERLMRTLTYLAQRLGADSTVDLITYGLRITHQDIATMIGSTRETTSLMLAELRNEKLIDYNRKCFKIHVDRIEKIIN